MRFKFRKFKVFLLVGLFVSIAGCENEKGATESRQTDQGREMGSAISADSTAELTISLSPPYPDSEDDLRALVSGGAGKLNFNWSLNGDSLPVSSDSDQLPESYFRRGDRISVNVTSEDGRQGSASVVIENAPPRIVAVPFRDPYVHRGKDIVVEPEAVDPDGDLVTFRYRWFINGAEESEDSQILAGDRIRKGDRVSLWITPADQEAEGEVYYGSDFTIPNAPPEFVSEPPNGFKSYTFIYDARAEDPDGDTLTYSLEAGPEGMTIDSETGRVVCRIGGNAVGVHTVRISAWDDDGAKAVQSFSLNIDI